MTDTIKRKVELYRVEILNRDNELYDKFIILQDLFENFFTNYSKKITEGFSVNKSKKFWVDYTNKSSIENYDTLEVKLTYSKFNKKVNVIKINDRSVVGGKNLDEGDEEKQHFLIKFFPNENYALIVFEKIVDSIPMTSIKKILNDYLKGKFIVSSQFDNKIKPRDIKFNIDPIISSDFIENIAHLKGIKLLKTIVTKESIDEDFRFSGEATRKELELVTKSEPSLLIRQNDVVAHCRKFIENGTIKDKRIIRIVIDGINSNNSKVKLDTEGMKLSESININLDINNTVDTNSIFEKFNDLIINKDDELEKFFNVTLNEEIAITEE